MDQATHTDVPDGDYEAVIEEFDITKSRKTGEPLLIWTFRIATGPCAGKTLKKFRILKDAWANWIREEIDNCGIQLDDVYHIHQHAPKLIGKPVRIARRTRNQFANIYITSPRARQARETREEELVT